MSTKKATSTKTSKGKYRPLTVGSVEAETGQKTNIRNKELKVSTYFKREGFTSLGQVLEKVEHHLAK